MDLINEMYDKSDELLESLISNTSQLLIEYKIGDKIDVVKGGKKIGSLSVHEDLGDVIRLSGRLSPKLECMKSDLVERNKIIITEDDEDDEGETLADKEYLGNKDQTHYYFVRDISDDGNVENLLIVNQDEDELFNAEEKEMDVEDPSAFILAALDEIDIDNISYDIYMNYIYSAYIEQEEPEIEDEEEPVEPEEEETEEEISVEDEEEAVAPTESRNKKDVVVTIEAIGTTELNRIWENQKQLSINYMGKIHEDNSVIKIKTSEWTKHFTLDAKYNLVECRVDEGGNSVDALVTKTIAQVLDWINHDNVKKIYKEDIIDYLSDQTKDDELIHTAYRTIIKKLATKNINILDDDTSESKRVDEDIDAEETEKVHNWMKNLDDDSKMRFAINWRIPHTLFNVACKMYPGGCDALQNIDWYKIFKSKDLGTWSHGGKVNVIGGTSEGKTVRGQRDGTGPHKDSAQASRTNKGKRKEAGIKCPNKSKIDERPVPSLDSIAQEIGIDWNKYDKKEFELGMKEEQEHGETVDWDPIVIAKIVKDHLDEYPDYYTRLAGLKDQDSSEQDKEDEDLLVTSGAMEGKAIRIDLEEFAERTGLSDEVVDNLRKPENEHRYYKNGDYSFAIGHGDYRDCPLCDVHKSVNESTNIKRLVDIVPIREFNGKDQHGLICNGKSKIHEHKLNKEEILKLKKGDVVYISTEGDDTKYDFKVTDLDNNMIHGKSEFIGSDEMFIEKETIKNDGSFEDYSTGDIHFVHSSKDTDESKLNEFNVDTYSPVEFLKEYWGEFQDKLDAVDSVMHRFNIDHDKAIDFVERAESIKGGRMASNKYLPSLSPKIKMFKFVVNGRLPESKINEQYGKISILLNGKLVAVTTEFKTEEEAKKQFLMIHKKEDPDTVTTKRMDERVKTMKEFVVETVKTKEETDVKIYKDDIWDEEEAKKIALEVDGIIARIDHGMKKEYIVLVREGKVPKKPTDDKETDLIKSLKEKFGLIR